MKKTKTIILLLLATLVATMSLCPALANTQPAPPPNLDNTNKAYVKAPSTVNLYPGQRETITLEVVPKKSSSVLKVLGVTATTDKPNEVFITDTGYQDTSRPKGSQKFTYEVQASDLASNLNAAIKFQVDYYYDDDTAIQSATATTNVRVLKTEPTLIVSRTDVIPSNRVKAGESFSVGFEFTNTGSAPIENVVVSLEGLQEKKVGVTRGLTTQTILNIPAGGREYVSFDLTTSRDIPSGNQEIPMTWKVGSGEGGYAGSGNFFIFVTKGANADSTLVLENIQSPSGTLYRGGQFSVKFNVKNQGTQEARNVLVEAVPSETTGVASRTVSQKVIPLIKPGEVLSFDYGFIVAPSAATQNYPIKIAVSYEDDSTAEEKKVVEQFVGAFVKAPDEDGKDTPKSTPKLIIDKYSFDPTLVPAGSTFDMTLSFFNTNESKTVKNIKIFLTSNDTTDKQSNTAGSSVFTPVDSSNTFYIDSIPPKGRVEKTITMYTVPDASAKTYEVTANFEYEDTANNPFTATELIGIPVIQESKLEVGEIGVMPPTATVGEPVDLMVDFYNTGKVTLYNTMVKATGDFSGENLTYYVGNFESGSSDNFSAVIFPNEPGQLKGTISFTYEDSSGQLQTDDHEFSIEVMEAMPMDEDDMNPDDYPGYGQTSIFKKPLFWIVIVILAAIVFGVVKKIKKNKEKKGLNLDE